MAFFKFAGSRDARYIEELKNSDLPIYIYGRGVMANMISKKLARNNLLVSGFVVDDKYFVDEQNCIKKSALEKLGTKYSLVVGIESMNNKDTAEIKTHFNNCQNVFQFSSVLEELNLVGYLTKEFYEKHSDRIDDVYYSLHDDFSKKCFSAYLHAKIEENISYLNGYVTKPQYFFENEFWKFSDNEILVDGGAFNGDTIADFMSFISQNGGGGV